MLVVMFCVSVCSQHSNLLNQSRLAVLKARDDSVKGLVEEARTCLGDVTKNSAKYKKMLEDLIAQVCLATLYPV